MLVEVVQMKMGKYKNIVLSILVILSQIHVLFRGVDFRFVWSNGVAKTASFSVFLLSHHITSFILIYLLYCLSKQKKLTLYLLILSFLDIIHFIALSGFGFELEKIALSLFIYYLTTKFNEWRR